MWHQRLLKYLQMWACRKMSESCWARSLCLSANIHIIYIWWYSRTPRCLVCFMMFCFYFRAPENEGIAIEMEVILKWVVQYFCWISLTKAKSPQCLILWRQNDEMCVTNQILGLDSTIIWFWNVVRWNVICLTELLQVWVVGREVTCSLLVASLKSTTLLYLVAP